MQRGSFFSGIKRNGETLKKENKVPTSSIQDPIEIEEGGKQNVQALSKEMSGLSVFHFTDKAAYTTNKIWQWQASSTSYINAQAGSEEATRTKIERKGGGYGSERQKRLIVKSQSRPNKRKKKKQNKI
jgi:hypothetical protein